VRTIWVDADGCPQVIKAILYRAAARGRVDVVLVANRRLRVPEMRYVQVLPVPGGPDAADDRIVESVQPGDLVVTADVPLASRVVEKGGTALNPRGSLYTEENVGERLAVRDFLHGLREDGVRTSGPPPLDAKARQRFANQLDRWLAQDPSN
jgi:uncharacterized protein YaiI (UPF0178 family)